MNAGAIDEQLTVLNMDLPRKATMRAVIAAQVCHGIQIGQFVDGDKLQRSVGKPRRLPLTECTHDTASDAPKTVNRQAKPHVSD